MKQTPNPTPHSDAREAAHLEQPSQPRAGGRERWVAHTGSVDGI